MDRKSTSSSVVWAVLLILIGVAALVLQVVPNWDQTLDLSQTWPLLVIGAGLFLLALGVGVGRPQLAIPACILGGIGGILAWQNYTGEWESWAYVWTLIPGFVGVGIILSNLLGRERGDGVRGGIRLLVLSIVLFAAFTTFFSLVGLAGAYAPILLIAVGVVLLAWSGMDAVQRLGQQRALEPPLEAGSRPRGDAPTLRPTHGGPL